LTNVYNASSFKLFFKEKEKILYGIDILYETLLEFCFKNTSFLPNISLLWTKDWGLRDELN
jgi:hypothetical protein